MTSENEKALIRSMMGCLYNTCVKYPGLVEVLELYNHDTSYFIKLVFTRQIRSNEYVPSRFIMPHSDMFEAVGLDVCLSRDKDGIPTYSIIQFDWLPNSGHYLRPFTGLYENILRATKQWATTMTYVMDSPRLAATQVHKFKLDLIKKAPLII